MATSEVKVVLESRVATFILSKLMLLARHGKQRVVQVAARVKPLPTKYQFSFSNPQ